MEKEICKKCGSEKKLVSGMFYSNDFDESNPNKQENFEHTHEDVLVCINCLEKENGK